MERRRSNKMAVNLAPLSKLSHQPTIRKILVASLVLLLGCGGKTVHPTSTPKPKCAGADIPCGDEAITPAASPEPEVKESPKPSPTNPVTGGIPVVFLNGFG